MTVNEVIQSALTAINTRLADVNTDEKDIKILVEKLDDVNEMIKSGITFTDAELADLPQVLRDEIQVQLADLLTSFDIDTANAINAFISEKSTELDNFNTEKTSALTAFNTEKTSALTAFDTEKTSALDNFNDEKTLALADIVNILDSTKIAYDNDTLNYISNVLSSGSIIEVGSNASGKYIKLADRTLICLCSGTRIPTSTSSDQFGSTSGLSYYAQFTVNYPHEFADYPDIIASSNGRSIQSHVSETLVSSQLLIWHNAESSRNYSLFLIGKF